jgi:KDO2-lipid IV(A) lauroyltransferase
VKKLPYYAMLAAGWAARIVPIGLLRLLMRAGGLFYYYAFAGKREQVKRNMRRALGPEASDREVDRAARSACGFYADYWLDLIWLPTVKREWVLERFGRDGEEPLVRTINEGKGVIVVLPHYGSWEAGAVYLSSLGPFAAVAEVLKPPELFDLFVKLRAGVGITIFPYDNKPETRDRMVEELKGGMMLALLSDRDLKGTGVEVEFFGERTTLPPGPAAMALRSGSPIICVKVRNVKGAWVGHASDPIRVDGSVDRDEAIKDTMQEVAHQLERLIRSEPSQWHMFMPGWPSDREHD